MKDGTKRGKILREDVGCMEENSSTFNKLYPTIQEILYILQRS